MHCLKDIGATHTTNLHEEAHLSGEDYYGLVESSLSSSRMRRAGAIRHRTRAANWSRLHPVARIGLTARSRGNVRFSAGESSQSKDERQEVESPGRSVAVGRPERVPAIRPLLRVGSSMWRACDSAAHRHTSFEPIPRAASVFDIDA